MSPPRTFLTACCLVPFMLGSLLLSLPAAAQAQEVYFNDFEGAVGSEWSVSSTDTTPAGNRRFLGQFTNQTATLSLSGLPAHAAITVSFQLFIIRTWDGSAGNGAAGPDEWRLAVSGGPTLLDSTFANYPGHTQDYPDATNSGINHPLQEGAAEVNTLGYLWPDVGNMDAVYNLSFTFPHTAQTVSLNFQGLGLQEVEDESWGIDNVRILALSPATVSGVITLEGCLNSVQPIFMELHRLNSSAILYRAFLLHADGSFRVRRIPPAPYHVWIKGLKWLAKTVTVDASKGDVSDVAATLPAGDVNGDNTVDIFDLGDLASAFSSTPTDSRWDDGADLNCDDSVDITDLSLLADNFFQDGDP